MWHVVDSSYVELGVGRNLAALDIATSWRASRSTAPLLVARVRVDFEVRCCLHAGLDLENVAPHGQLEQSECCDRGHVY